MHGGREGGREGGKEKEKEREREGEGSHPDIPRSGQRLGPRWAHRDERRLHGADAVGSI